MDQLKRKRSNGGGVIKWKTNMFANTTSMTSVILYLITTKTKTPKNITKSDGVGMTQTSVPKNDAIGEQPVRWWWRKADASDRTRQGCHIGDVPS